MRFLVFAAALAVLAVSAAAFAAGPLPVISANGFSCTAQPVGERNLVECMGQFQGVAGLYAATGYDMVHVDFTPDNQRRYSYMSETGCLILAAADKTALATDKSGVKKQFSSYTDAMQWCYTGGAAQKPAPQATPQAAPPAQSAPQAAPQAAPPAQQPGQQALPPAQPPQTPRQGG